jgi:predicted nucleic acid-binding Zn ribbon protein
MSTNDTHHVTDSSVEPLVGGTGDAESRDCAGCGKTIGPTEPVCIFARWGNEAQSFTPYCAACAEKAQRRHDADLYRRWHTEGEEDSDWIAEHNTELEGYDPWREWPERACEVCSRPIRVDRGTERVCSSECKSRLPAFAASARRRRMREAVTPERFTCHRCEKEIEGTIAFWWARGAGERRLEPWCEPCFVAERTESDRKRFAESDDGRSSFGRPLADPDAEGYDPFGSIHGYDPTPCGNCGRIIRWSYTHRTTSRKMDSYCSEACHYEAAKAARRVTPKPRKCSAPGCNNTFTPKRKDAKTCSDRCRQRLRRGGKKAKRKVTDKRVEPETRGGADATKRDRRTD